uniref:retention module-containing protein n=1 Tax=Photobacterium leiognathi TaxID=553611 RepID=UPI00298255CA|nr:retention module-containing protein [Photobacterium leiognathi]
MKVFATSLAGKVQNIHGRVIINNNGAIETVVLGQFIPAGAVLQCDANATLTLTTDDHRHIFFDGQESHITPTVIDGRNTDVAAIQSLISSGDDPTKHAKASASGNPTHAGGFGYVTLQRNGDEVLAKTDFSTSGQHRDEHLNTELFDIEVHQTGLVIKGETYTVPEDNKVVLNLLDNDTSVSGDPLSIHSINGTPLTGSDQTIVIEHGHITITADGTITFIPEPNFNGEVNVDYTVTDGTSEEHGHSTVIVTPVNDAPIANPDSFTTDEDTSITVDLTKNDHDVDGDTLTIKEINGTPLTGGEQTVVVDNGKIVIAHDGGMTFVPNKDYNGTADVNYTISDGDKSASSTAKIIVNPEPDTAVISGQVKASVTEDSNVITESEHHWLKVDGTLSITDPDVPGTTFNHTVRASDAAWGTLAIDDKGHWTYHVNNDAKKVQGLTAYDPKDPHSYHVEHFTVTTGDGAKETITITIKGSEDTAVISGQDKASVTEDSNVITESEHHWLKVDGTLSITDLDVPGTTFNHTVSASDAAWGTLAIDDKGHWTYHVNNDAKEVQGLTAYDPKDPHSYHVEHFTVTTGDGAKETITITIKGSEDTAVISGQAEASVTEDSNVITESEHHWLKVDGTLSITDPDVPGTTFNHTVSASDAAWGTLAIDDKGHWTYHVNNDAKEVQGLTAYDPKDPHSYHVEHFTVTTGDGAKETITITIKGSEDTAVISGQAEASVTEDSNVITESEHHWLKVDGTLSITDPDVSGTTFNHTVIASDAAWGKLTIDDKGHWTYHVNNDAKEVQGLTAYDPKDPHSYHVEHFTVTTGDGAKETITITIKGSEDTAVISGQAEASVTEDSNVITESDHHWLKVDGTLSITDLDVPGTTFNHTVRASDTAWGTLAIDDKGHWTYRVNNDAKEVQGLTAYDPKDPHSYHVEHFTVTTGDGAKETITITIKGTNDNPIIEYPDMNGTWISADYTEGTGGQSLTTKISLSDIDSEKLSMARITITPQVGENSYDPLHDSFVLSKAFQSKYELISDNYIDENHQEVGVWLLKTEDNSFVPVQEFENVLKHLEYKNTAEHMVGINQSKSIGIDVYDDHNAVSNRLSIAVKMHEVNDAPKIELHNNGSVNVSEEGLANGNPDNIGNPEDTTNKTVAEGSFKVTDVDSTNVSVRLEGPEGITSNGKSIDFTWDQSSQELIGFIGDTDNKAMMIKLSESNGEYKYTANLFAPVDHLDGHSENIKDIIINVISDDHNSYNGKSISHIKINIEDDKPLITEITYDKPILAPHINTDDYFFDNVQKNNYFFRTYNYDSIGHEQGFNGITITAKGFDETNSGWSDRLIDAEVNASTSGIGVKSESSPYFPLDNEIEGRLTSDGQFLSEELIIKLDSGSVAYGAHINFSQMYGGELESGIVYFYRDGKEITHKIFNSDADSGNFARNFNVDDKGGFDEIIIKATDNGSRETHWYNSEYKDNSDFTVKSIYFLGKDIHSSNEPYYQSGMVYYKTGADHGELQFNQLGSIVGTLDDYGQYQAINIEKTGNSIVGIDTLSEDVIFRFELTPATGKWEFYQYKDFHVFNNHNQILHDEVAYFKVSVVDGDNDAVYENIEIKPAELESQILIFNQHESEHELLLNLHHESIVLNNNDKGFKVFTHFNVNKDHLDLSDLLHSVKDNELDKFLTLRQDGKNTDIAINTDGKGDIEQHIILDNVNSNDVVKNIGVITNNLLHSDGDKLILNTHQDLHAVMPEHHPLISIHHEEQIS